ncbi:MAG TPA: signal recognition particle-docking protein FtsY [Nitrososphaeraceae archaeon]|nr:signal recognition particle-docking protein FtsY [Nitrososphaeraceae archaeon]
MFDKLKKAFSNIISDISKKEISEKDLENTLFDLEIALLESDVAQEVIDDISANLKNKLLGLSVEKDKTPEELIQFHVQKSIYEILTKSGTLDLVKKINFKKENKGGPFVVVFLGINGTGKTTTVAKVANLLHKNGLSVVLAASDTHRAGAIEQLGEHARRLSLKMIHQRYGADPSAVARDAVEYGKKHRVDAILIDTAGRMQTAKNLMDEISKIVQVVKPDLKIFIGDSLAGNDAIYQAKEFFAYTKFDASILTKTDADAKGGAIISITYLTSKPIIYLGVGQKYDDIIPFNLDTFIESLFGSQISEEITNKYSSNIINESNNNEKLPEIKSKSISDNESIHSVEELYQNKPSSSNLDPIISNNLDNNDIVISKVGVKEEEKKVDYQKNNNTINLENDPQFSKSEKMTGTKEEDSKTLLDKSYSSNSNNDNEDSKKQFVTEKTAENKDQKKKGFFSSLFGKRKSQVDSKVLSTDEQKNKQNNQGKSNSDKNEDNATNKNEISEKNKNKDKNEVKYLSDDDLDELLKE